MAAQEIGHLVSPTAFALCDALDAVRAEIRRVNRAYGTLHRHYLHERNRAEDAEARLAEVEALCQKRRQEIAETWGGHIAANAGRVDVADVLALVRGETARPGEGSTNADR